MGDDVPADARPAAAGTLPAGFGRQLLAAVNPALAGRLGSFRRATAQLPATALGRKVAVIGQSPGCGTSTVVAALALAAQGYTSQGSPLNRSCAGQGDARGGQLGVGRCWAGAQSLREAVEAQRVGGFA